MLYVTRRRRRQLHLRRLRPGRRPGQPVRRPARAATHTPPTAEGGALRPRTCAPRATRPASTARCCASNPTPARAPRQPAGRGADRYAPDRRPRLPQPVPVRVPPRHQRGLGRRRRLGRLGGDRPRRRPDRARSATSAGPATRARGAMAAYDDRTWTCARPCTRRVRRTPRRCYTYNHAAKVGAGENCSSGTSSISGVAFYDGRRFPRAYQGAVLRRLRPHLHLGDVPGANGMPNPRTRELRAGAAVPVDLVSRPGRRPLLRRRRRRHDPADPLRRVQPAPTAASSRRPRAEPAAAGPVRRYAARPTPTATRSPTPGTSTATAATTTRPRAPTRTYTSGGRTVRLRVTDPRRPPTPTVDRGRRSPADAAITAPGAADLCGRRHGRLRGHAATGTDGLPGRAARVDGRLNHCSATATTATCTTSRTSPACVGSFVRPTTSTRPPSSADRDRRGRAASTRPVRSTRRPSTSRSTACPPASPSRLAAKRRDAVHPHRLQGSTVVSRRAADARRPQLRLRLVVGRRRGDAPVHGARQRRRVHARFTEMAARSGRAGRSVGLRRARAAGGLRHVGPRNHGEISGAARVADGRFGAALSFDGANDLVTVATRLRSTSPPG